MLINPATSQLGEGGRGGCVQRIEVIVKMQKKKSWGGVRGGGGSKVGGSG